MLDVVDRRMDNPIYTAFPVRQGPPPHTTVGNPHTQLDQQPAASLSKVLLGRIATLPGVTLGPSERAPHGTVGLYVAPNIGRGPSEAFMLGREFAHVHPAPDHSLHMTLPHGVRESAIAAGWAIAHPMAGDPSISANLVMVYAPRDAAEADIVTSLLTASWRFAAAPRSD